MRNGLIIGATALVVYASSATAQSLQEPSSTQTRIAQEQAEATARQAAMAAAAAAAAASVDAAASSIAGTRSQSGRANTPAQMPPGKTQDVIQKLRETERRMQALLDRLKASESMKAPQSGQNEAAPPSRNITDNDSAQVALDNLRQVTNQQQENAGAKRPDVPTGKAPGAGTGGGSSASVISQMRESMAQLNETNQSIQERRQPQDQPGVRFDPAAGVDPDTQSTRNAAPPIQTPSRSVMESSADTPKGAVSSNGGGTSSSAGNEQWVLVYRRGGQGGPQGAGSSGKGGTSDQAENGQWVPTNPQGGPGGGQWGSGSSSGGSEGGASDQAENGQWVPMHPQGGPGGGQWGSGSSSGGSEGGASDQAENGQWVPMHPQGGPGGPRGAGGANIAAPGNGGSTSPSRNITDNNSAQVALDTLRQVTNQQQENAGAKRPDVPAGKAPGAGAGDDSFASVIAQVNEAMARLNESNRSPQEKRAPQDDLSPRQGLDPNAGIDPDEQSAGKLSAQQRLQQQQQQVLAGLPTLLQDAVRDGLLTMEEAQSFAQDTQGAPAVGRLPSQQKLDAADVLRTFVQTASIANAAGSAGAGSSRHLASFISATLQQGLTQTGTEFASQERIEAAADPWSDFPYYSSGQVTAIAPDQSIHGAAEGSYTGRMAGAFGNGDAVSGTMTMSILFATGEMEANISFAGGNGSALIVGNATGTSVSGTFYPDPMTNNAFGGIISGGVNGKMYGPRGEEVGGDWNLSVSGGSRNGQSASGGFAVKQ